MYTSRIKITMGKGWKYVVSRQWASANVGKGSPKIYYFDWVGRNKHTWRDSPKFYPREYPYIRYKSQCEDCFSLFLANFH